MSTARIENLSETEENFPKPPDLFKEMVDSINDDYPPLWGNISTEEFKVWKILVKELQSNFDADPSQYLTVLFEIREGFGYKINEIRTTRAAREKFKKEKDIWLKCSPINDWPYCQANKCANLLRFLTAYLCEFAKTHRTEDILLKGIAIRDHFIDPLLDFIELMTFNEKFFNKKDKENVIENWNQNINLIYQYYDQAQVKESHNTHVEKIIAERKAAEALRKEKDNGIEPGGKPILVVQKPIEIMQVFPAIKKNTPAKLVKPTNPSNKQLLKSASMPSLPIRRKVPTNPIHIVKTAEQHTSFLQRHWGKMLIGGLVCTLLAIGAVYSFGVVPLIIGGIALGLGTSLTVATYVGLLGVAVGGALVGLSIGAAGGAVSESIEMHERPEVSEPIVSSKPSNIQKSSPTKPIRFIKINEDVSTEASETLKKGATPSKSIEKEFIPPKASSYNPRLYAPSNTPIEEAKNVTITRNLTSERKPPQ